MHCTEYLKPFSMVWFEYCFDPIGNFNKIPTNKQYSQTFSITYRSDTINDRGFLCIFLVVFSCLFRYKRPEFVQVNTGAKELVVCLVVIPHSNLTKITRMAESDIQMFKLYSTDGETDVVL